MSPILRRTPAGARPIDVVDGDGYAAGGLPMVNAAGILVGLPGGDVYLRADVELGLVAEHRLNELARVHAIKLSLFIRNRQAARYGLAPELADVAASRDELRRARAAGAGLELAPNRDKLIENARAALRRLKGPR